ncbi:CCHC-type domain-containing protein [Heracleum sosnowskyi]|uniref:CCHC-type domain-containing protein n=1 Tax=Heracleum sosnowskyi TaxID=360622 RepID=A0AAD8MSN7_9APIA|nr:CCHC-type domain-containing protein [Heracleum sosnowskyi]
MAEGLEHKLKGLVLTEEEEQIIECDEDEIETIGDQLILCLVGKLLTSNPFSVEAMKNTMKVAWRVANGMVVREIENKLFIFQFFSMSDKVKVLEDGPWAFDGAPLLLKEVEEGAQPSEIVFDTISNPKQSLRLWVKAEDVPPNERTKSMAKSMAENMGTFVEFDETDPIGWSKNMCFRVDLRLDKPLKRGIRVATTAGSKWVSYRYERLMDLCMWDVWA